MDIVSCDIIFMITDCLSINSILKWACVNKTINSTLKEVVINLREIFLPLLKYPYIRYRLPLNNYTNLMYRDLNT